MPTAAFSVGPDPEEAVRRLRVLILRMRFLLVAILITLGLLVVWLSSLAVRFPAVCIPALLSAVFGYNWARRRAKSSSPLSPQVSQSLLMGRTLLWSIPGGALAYAVLAALQIGVPAPEVSLIWRVFGGAVFGAVAGVGAGCLLAILGLFPTLWSLLRQGRAA
jgi:hypothetical protein